MQIDISNFSVDNINKAYEEFENQLIKFAYSEEDFNRKRVIKKLKALLELSPNNLNIMYKIAVCSYEISNWTESNKEDIEKYFLRVVLLDKESVFSKMLLAFFYFDIGEYKLALATIHSITKKEVFSLPKWREKRLEQIELICFLRLYSLDETKAEEKIVNIFRSYLAEDIDEKEFIYPKEIIDLINNDYHQFIHLLPENI